jgi:hypothetical protein
MEKEMSPSGCLLKTIMMMMVMMIIASPGKRWRWTVTINQS